VAAGPIATANAQRLDDLHQSALEAATDMAEPTASQGSSAQRLPTARSLGIHNHDPHCWLHIKEIGPLRVSTEGENVNVSVAGVLSENGDTIRVSEKTAVEVLASVLERAV
jgi:hypothetical protein